MSKPLQSSFSCLPALIAMAMVAQPVKVASAEVVRSYQVEARVYSLNPQQGLDSVKTHGSGWGTPGSTLGYGFPAAKDPGDVRIDITQQGDRLLANLAITSKQSPKEKRHKIDLTDMKATSYELSQDQNGRTYAINLTPKVIETNITPSSFEKATADLYRLKFSASSVILNEEQYVGRMLASDASVISVQICGVADIEFSLHPLKNAEPWGQLQQGRLLLTNPNGTSVEITNVTNGTDNRITSGGPYRVWVRWKSEVPSVDEYRKSLHAIKKQLVSNGPVVLPNGETLVNPSTNMLLERIEAELKRKPGPWVIGCAAQSYRGN